MLIQYFLSSTGPSLGPTECDISAVSPIKKSFSREIKNYFFFVSTSTLDDFHRLDQLHHIRDVLFLHTLVSEEYHSAERKTEIFHVVTRRSWKFNWNSWSGFERESRRAAREEGKLISSIFSVCWVFRASRRHHHARREKPKQKMFRRSAFTFHDSRQRAFPLSFSLVSLFSLSQNFPHIFSWMKIVLSSTS